MAQFNEVQLKNQAMRKTLKFFKKHVDIWIKEKVNNDDLRWTFRLLKEEVDGWLNQPPFENLEFENSEIHKIFVCFQEELDSWFSVDVVIGNDQIENTLNLLRQELTTWL